MKKLFRNISFRLHFKRSFSSTKKDGEKSSKTISKFLVDMKSSSSDEQLRKNIAELEATLDNLQKSESIKAINDILKKGSAGLTTTKEGASKIAGKVGQVVGEASRPIQDLAEKVRPHIPDISQTEVARKVGQTVESIEQNASKAADFYKYGGVSSKNSRVSIEDELKRQQREKIPENPNAGSSVVHVPQKSASVWTRFKQVNPASRLVSYIKSSADKSDNFLVHFGRELFSSFTERVSSIFSESETASVIKSIRSRRPDFQLEEFLHLLRSYIVPEILESFVTGDLPSLRRWCSEGAYRVLEATLNPSQTAGHKFEGKVLDIRDLDMIAAKMIEDHPVIVISLTAQQLFCVKDIKGELVDGSDSGPENVQYIMAFTVDESEKNASGWSLVEIAIRDRNSTW